MRAIRHAEHGGLDVLRLETIDRPEPADDELLVEVTAAGVNPVDTYYREGSYEPLEFPFTPGVDVAGRVVETGRSVDEFVVGDRVFGTGIGNGSYQGAYAEYAAIPTDRVALVPDGVDLLEAGAAGVAAGTAWRSLVEIADLRPAEYCLVHGGSGGVGHTAVQIAHAIEARVIATAGADRLDAVRDIGADVALDYARNDLSSAVTDAAGGGVDVILDHRVDDYLQFDAEVANTFARVVCIGENRPDGGFVDTDVARTKDVHYLFMSLFNTPDLAETLRGVAHLLETGSLSIEIAGTYDLEEAAEAQRAVMEDRVLGKLVLEI